MSLKSKSIYSLAVLLFICSATVTAVCKWPPIEHGVALQEEVVSLQSGFANEMKNLRNHFRAYYGCLGQLRSLESRDTYIYIHPATFIEHMSKCAEFDLLYKTSLASVVTMQTRLKTIKATMQSAVEKFQEIESSLTNFDW